MADPLPLQIQRLGSYRAQVLVLLHVAELRAGERSASPADVRATFIKLRLPPPSNMSVYLGTLGRGRLVMQPALGRWSVTPEGNERIRALMAGVNEAELRRLAADSREPAFADIPHHLQPPELAPGAFQTGIARFLEGYPFDRNVFCMSRFPREDHEPLCATLAACRATCEELGLHMHLASDRAVEDLLFGNVAAAMWASRFGIGIFENRAQEGLNYNVVFEVGAMLVTGRRCLLLKDVTVEELPTDLVGHIYQPVDVGDIEAVHAAVQHWITVDLAIAG